MRNHATRLPTATLGILLLGALLPGAAAQDPVGLAATTIEVTLDPAAPVVPGNGSVQLNVTLAYTYHQAATLGGDDTSVAVTLTSPDPSLTATPANATVLVPVVFGTARNTTTATLNVTLTCIGPRTTTLTVDANASENGLLEGSQGSATAAVRCLEPPAILAEPANGTTNGTLGNATGNLSRGNDTFTIGNGTFGDTRGTEATEQRGLPGLEAAAAVAGLAVVALRRRRV